MTQYLSIILIAVSAMTTVPSIDAKSYFVSPTGNDNSNGSSWASAWRTIQHAVDNLQAGDTLTIRQGTYDGFSIKRSGTKQSPILIQGENADSPPTLTGGKKISKWSKSNHPDIWHNKTSSKPTIVLKDNVPLKKASTPNLTDGDWYWHQNILSIKLTDPSRHEIIRTSKGGGIAIKNQSWITLKNLECKLGLGACVSLNKSHNIVIENLHAKWMWRGVNISNQSSYNVVSNCLVEYNKEGIYILDNSHHNLVKNCKALHNGNLPVWQKGDRAGIAIGERGTNPYNTITSCEIAYNGGPDSDPGLIAYQAPHTTLSNNHVHNNYGSGIFITIKSDHSTASNNIVENNGKQAVKTGIKGIAALSVRRSNNVVLKNNIVKNNYVSPDSRWKGKDTGPRGGIDVRALPNDHMNNTRLINNIVYGTTGGPDYYTSPHTTVYPK